MSGILALIRSVARPDPGLMSVSVMLHGVSFVGIYSLYGLLQEKIVKTSYGASRFASPIARRYLHPNPSPLLQVLRQTSSNHTLSSFSQAVHSSLSSESSSYPGRIEGGARRYCALFDHPPLSCTTALSGHLPSSRVPVSFKLSIAFRCGFLLANLSCASFPADLVATAQLRPLRRAPASYR